MMKSKFALGVTLVSTVLLLGVSAQTQWPANTTFTLAADVAPKMYCLYANNVWQPCATGGTLDTTGYTLEEDGTQKATQPVGPSTVTFQPYPAGLPAGVTHTYRMGAVGPGGTTYSTPLAVMTPGTQPPPPSSTNLALNKTASANDTSAPTTTYAPSKAVDGDTATFWAPNCCGSGVNWWQVDLGAPYDIARVKSTWLAPRFPRVYQVQGSLSGTTWTTLPGGSITTGDGGADDVAITTPTSARYVRLNLQTYGGGEAGYYLGEVEVYAATATTPTPLTYTACTPPQTAISTTNQAVPFTMPPGTTSGGTAPITQTQSPLGPYNVGTTSITMTATDTAGQTATCQSSITVTFQPPALSLACTLLVSATSPDGNPVPVTIPDAAVTGGVSPIVQTKIPASGSLFPVGSSTVAISAVDAVGQTSACSTGVAVSYTPPPPPPPPWSASMSLDVGQCYVSVVTSGPPPGTTGYSGRARRHAPGSTSYTNIGNATSSSTVYPYTVKSGLVGAGTYVTEWVWTKSGATTQIQSAGQKTCGGSLP